MSWVNSVLRQFLPNGLNFFHSLAFISYLLFSNQILWISKKQELRSEPNLYNNNEIWEEDDEREDKDHWVETAAGRY